MRQILFEIETSIFSNEFYNAYYGVYYKRLFSNTDSYTDKKNVTGEYTFQFNDFQNILSVKINDEYYTETETIDDCIILEKSFFYDYTTQKVFIHFENNTRQLNNEVILGLIVGYSDTYNSDTENVYFSKFYEPRITSVPKLSKKVDPLFFGKLQFPSFTIDMINADGHFDNWRENDYFGTPARFLFANDPTDYTDFEKIYFGYIENDKTDWSSFNLDIADIRKKLEQPICKNTITSTDFPNAPDDSLGLYKPVAYGILYERPCICVDDTSSPKEFLFVDTEFNTPSSLDSVVDSDGSTVSTSAVSLSNGTFTAVTSETELYASFTMPIVNGVSIIKDLMKNYEKIIYISTFWNTTEVDAAETLSNNTSLFYDDDADLKDAIESVCFDCDLRFYYQNDGKISIRLYDSGRTPAATIYYDDWIDEPNRENNGSEYLTSCKVKYKFNGLSDEHTRQYFNDDYESAAFQKYKKLKTKDFETQLYEESAASDKSGTIMSISSNVSDIVKRTVNWNFKDLEITDFVTAAPFSRLSVGEDENLETWEIIGIAKDLDKFQIELTLRKV